MTKSLASLMLCCGLMLAKAATELETNRVSSQAFVTYVYHASLGELASSAKAVATNLWRVELLPGGSAKCQDWKRGTSGRDYVNKALAQLDCREFRFFWMPPPVKPRKVSAGGKVVPLRSCIWISVGALRTNDTVAFVTLRRDLEESATLHVPYPEIPFGRGHSSIAGVYRTDLDWLEHLLGTNVPVGKFTGAVFYDAEVMNCLRSHAK